MTSAHRLLIYVMIGAACSGARAIAGDSRQPSDGEIRDALVSIYWHAYLVRDGKEPTIPGHPMEVRDAADVIARDDSFGGSTRRRRAIGKLGAAYKVLTAPGATVRLSADDVRHALETLGAPSSVITVGAERQPDFVHLEQGVYEQLNAARSNLQAKFAAQCCSCIMSCTTFEDKTTTKALYTIRVGRDLGSLQVVTDPQKWSACNPKYFVDTHYAGVDCASAVNNVTSPTIPPPGSDWTGDLSEHFSNAQGVDLTNLLNICGGQATTPPTHTLNYGLCKAKQGTASLLADCGFATTMADPAAASTPFQSRLVGLKILQFKNLSPGTIAMEAMVDETAQVAVFCNLQQPRCDCGAETCALAGQGSSLQNTTCSACNP